MSFRPTHKAVALLLTLVCTVVITACGYSIRQAPAVKEIRIGTIRNLTFEPSIQDTFILALERELTRLGVRVDRSAAHTIEGKITQVKIKGTVEEKDMIVQYEISITGEFWVINPEGKRIDLKGRDSFIVSFGGSGSLERLMSSKEGAIEAALANLAADIASDIASDRGVQKDEAPTGINNPPDGTDTGNTLRSEEPDTLRDIQ